MRKLKLAAYLAVLCLLVGCKKNDPDPDPDLNKNNNIYTLLITVDGIQISDPSMTFLYNDGVNKGISVHLGTETDVITFLVLQDSNVVKDTAAYYCFINSGNTCSILENDSILHYSDYDSTSYLEITMFDEANKKVSGMIKGNLFQYEHPNQPLKKELIIEFKNAYLFI